MTFKLMGIKEYEEWFYSKKDVEKVVSRKLKE